MEPTKKGYFDIPVCEQVDHRGGDCGILLMHGFTGSPSHMRMLADGLIAKGYTVYCVGKELASINDVPGEIDVIDLCIHPAKGIELLRACEKPFKCIVIQPGAESEEILRYLDEKGLPYLEGCLLVGLSLYAGTDQAKGQD